MHCILCENLSFYIICKNCQNRYLQPSFYKREIEDGFFNYSFYALSEIQELINSKYYFYGDKVYKILAYLSFKTFALNFSYKQKVFAIAIDDHTRHDFSHTAILASSLKSKYILPKYNILKAQNHIKYAGKDLKYRQKNPRRFKVKNLTKQTTILCDDLITTGSTILEAKKALENKNNQVLFSLTLADAKI
ncbi:phosphoribosyltransferase [Malaciobacter mytili LMG 24559]|uniref:Phosphoribosyltransferase n=1 Tax=Malaciobacter mytili LMG 24559 TaxID=1032238 RepID=A0AAX2AJD5_9BACT|nr:ComF family protein [Malaciobacter mytili]AXH14191.1 transformation system, predicted amidophosphoribosyltransferase CtsW [Malaciobacter mytili LMG 24559]RXK16281.1 phosphoribosyltransferase [Malaciobacter mytili LMG 24559]